MNNTIKTIVTLSVLSFLLSGFSYGQDDYETYDYYPDYRMAEDPDTPYYEGDIINIDGFHPEAPTHLDRFEQAEIRAAQHEHRIARYAEYYTNIDFSRYHGNKLRNQVHQELEKKFGNQVATDSNGNFYIKEPKDGFGYSSDAKYYGNFQNGVRHGYGKLTTSRGYYKGFWYNDLQDGFGEEVVGESIYKGQFSKGRRHGYGQTKTPNTTFYGDYFYGQMKGEGFFVKHSPEEEAFQYQGQFEDGWANGLGAFQDAKFVELGTFVNGYLKESYDHLIVYKQAKNPEDLVQKSKFNSLKMEIYKNGDVKLNTSDSSYSGLESITIKSNLKKIISYKGKEYTVNEIGEISQNEQVVSTKELENIIYSQASTLRWHTRGLAVKSRSHDQIFYQGNEGDRHRSLLRNMANLAESLVSKAKTRDEFLAIQRLLNDAHTHLAYSMGSRHLGVQTTELSGQRVNRITDYSDNFYADESEKRNKLYGYVQAANPADFKQVMEKALEYAYGRINKFFSPSYSDRVKVGDYSYDPVQGFYKDLEVLQHMVPKEEFNNYLKAATNVLAAHPRDALRLTVENLKRANPFSIGDFEKIIKQAEKTGPISTLTFRKETQSQKNIRQQYLNIPSSTLANLARENNLLNQEVKNYVDNYRNPTVPDDFKTEADKNRAKLEIYRSAENIINTQTFDPTGTLLKNISLKITKYLYDGAQTSDELIAMVNLSRKLTDLISSQAPVVSGVRDIFESLYGHDFFTGKKLDNAQRIFKAAMGVYELATLGLLPSRFSMKAVEENLESLVNFYGTLKNKVGINHSLNTEKITEVFNDTKKILEEAGVTGYQGTKNILGEAFKIGVKTPGGLKVFQKVQKAIRDFPLGLKIKRMKEGRDLDKIALIGRKMDGVVDDTAAYLKRSNIDAATFSDDAAWDDFVQVVKKYREKVGDPKAFLPNNEVVKTKLYQKNKEWIQHKLDNGFTIIDMGDPQGLNVFSPFYAMEKKTVFGK